ncbi:hypothetical protein V7200_08545 [Cytobacillus firmus]|uniref:hypothetical protein n=1 Tax=Cytobacillus firmus TaxID=1399 RepID=UPI00133193DB|nr:hypothetical protein [Cytobacillus firmus]
MININSNDYKKLREDNIEKLKWAQFSGLSFAIVFLVVLIIASFGVLENFGYNTVTPETLLTSLQVFVLGSITIWLTSTIALASVKD